MKWKLKFLACVVAVIVVIMAIMAEAWLRQRHSEPLALEGLPIAGAVVSGFHMPDFLWSGRAWWIEIETQEDLILELDDWSGEIPAGTHTIFSNHDATNTGEYGSRDFWGFPNSLRIQPKRTQDDRNAD